MPDGYCEFIEALGLPVGKKEGETIKAYQSKLVEGYLSADLIVGARRYAAEGAPNPVGEKARYALTYLLGSELAQVTPRKKRENANSRSDSWERSLTFAERAAEAAGQAKLNRVNDGRATYWAAYAMVEGQTKSYELPGCGNCGREEARRYLTDIIEDDLRSLEAWRNK